MFYVFRYFSGTYIKGRFLLFYSYTLSRPVKVYNFFLMFPASERASIFLMGSPDYNCLSLLGLSLKVKMAMEHRWNDSERKNPI
jgi:hypothetical protein